MRRCSLKSALLVGVAVLVSPFVSTLGASEDSAPRWKQTAPGAFERHWFADGQHHDQYRYYGAEGQRHQLERVIQQIQTLRNDPLENAQTISKLMMFEALLRKKINQPALLTAQSGACGGGYYEGPTASTPSAHAEAGATSTVDDNAGAFAVVATWAKQDEELSGSLAGSPATSASANAILPIGKGQKWSAAYQWICDTQGGANGGSGTF